MRGRGLCVAAGVPPTDELDGDGIPRWGRHDEYGYHHAGAGHMALAFYAATYGFHLPEFDVWLSALNDCPAKRDLITRRAEAMRAMRANEHDTAIRALEYMELRMYMIQREEFLLPLAQRDKARQDGTTKPRNPELQAWIEREAGRAPDATAKELWNRAPEWVTDQIGLDRFRKRLATARKAIGMGRK